MPAAATPAEAESDTGRMTLTQANSMTAETDTINYTDSSENESTETIRYVDPANISDTPPRATSLERAGLQIAESLGIRLEVSANELSEQNYSAAESTLGPAYQSDVVRLTEIAEATENTSDDQLAQALETAGTNQRVAVDTAQEFQTLYTAYQQARASQNETRAREIAQELAATTTELNRTSSNLTAAYAELAELNETRAERAQQQIEEALAQAEQLSENAQRSTYIETNISINSVSAEASPNQPLTISGTLRDTNGTALANRTVELATPQGPIQTQTNDSGEFNFTHAPTQLPAGTSPLSIQYIPRETAGYLGSEATVSPQVSSLPPTVSVNSTPATLSNTSTATVTGTALVDQQALSGIPIRVRLDGTVLGETETDQTGTFRVPVSVPITTAAGERVLTIEAGGAGQAVELVTEQRSVTVEPIETDLEISATRTNTTTVAVNGQLTRPDDQPVASQLVTITVGDQPVGYLQTDPTGQFASEFTLTDTHPAIDGTEQTTTVSAEFTNETTHLTPAQASTTVTFFPVEGAFGYGIPALGWAFGVIVGTVGIASVAVIWWYRKNDSDETTQSDSSVTPDSAVPTTDENPTATTSPASLFERAETVIDSAPDEALQVGYLAARRALAEKINADAPTSVPSATHWEFYQTIESADVIDEELTAAFESLTVAYEQSTFTPTAATSADVQEVLTPIRSQLSTE
jgi:hypothetical protein